MRSKGCCLLSEREALRVLNAAGHFGPERIGRLTEHFGSLAAAVLAEQNELIESRILSPGAAQKLAEFQWREFLDNENELLKKCGVCVLTLNDKHYSALLREIPDAPVILYIKGDPEVLNSPSLAVVGSRLASVYGISIAEKFSARLAETGITIVSGLAKGVDAAAHRGALKGRGRTVAVLGCGLAEMYPPENRSLAEEIAQAGAVVSEFPMTMPPVKYNFPQRNRIISGLSLGVLVAEAAQKSGALITSRFALEQGREVFAVPGKVDSPNAAGVNNLIQQGAKLIMSVEDILEELSVNLRPYTQDTAPEPITEFPADLSEEEKEILGYLGSEASHLDCLASESGQTPGWLSSRLLNLELKGAVKQLPGKYFKLTS